MSACVPAILTAGDRAASRPVHGESKVYLEIGGELLVVRAVRALQEVPEISEVWVVGNAERLEDALRPLEAELRKPLHIVPQFRNLYENCWETYRRLLPGAPLEGRDPASEAELDLRVLYLSADLPFATAAEISHFIHLALASDCDFACGMSTEASMEPFYPKAPGEPGIHMAYFNTREGRLRQNNLHLVRPGRMTNRFYIEEMYEHRYQKQFGAIAGLAWRLLRSQTGGVRTLGYYFLLQLASVIDRRGWRGLADRVRRLLPLSRLAAGVSQLLGTHFRFTLTELGGCAVDIDNEEDCDAARARFEEWYAAQRTRAEAVRGALPAPEGAGELRVLPERAAS